MNKAVLPVQIRRMIRKDLGEVMAIEHDSFIHPWSAEDMLRELRDRSTIGMVAMDRVSDVEDVIGYFVYRLHKRYIEIRNLAVCHKYHRNGIGRQMVEKLIGKLCPTRRRRIEVLVSDFNLGAQLFFRAMGFKCERIVHGAYEEGDVDAYLFVYRMGDESPAMAEQAAEEESVQHEEAWS